MSKKVIQGEKTKKLILNVARKLFRKGYDSVSTPDIALAAEVTRGALYHHFDDKDDIFREVVIQIAAEIVLNINKSASIQEKNPKLAVIEGCLEFLKVASNAEYRQIFLLDAPTVLGWSEWRAIDAQYGLGSLKEGLLACAEMGMINKSDIEIVALLISGALNEMVFYLAEKEKYRVDSRLAIKVSDLVSAFIISR